MRAFKVKVFARWARKEGITDAILVQAAQEIADGQVEADLGGYLFKKRIAKAGQGKSGSYRVIVAFKRAGSDRVFFLFGFDKNDVSTISQKERKAHAITADVLVSLAEEHIATLLSGGLLFEIVETDNDQDA